MCLDGQQHGISYGRVDQYLGSFYQADVAAGRIRCIAGNAQLPQAPGVDDAHVARGVGEEHRVVGQEGIQ